MLILHLSDIHFRMREIETAQDPNYHLRNELLQDIKAQCSTLGVPAAIIISGDTAFAGHKDEFAIATEWLTQLCVEISADPASIFVCPGNHDVVRSVADARLTQLIHEDIKARELADVNRKIADYLLEPPTARLLYESLDAYNDFALQFFCDLLPPNRTRATRDLVLNDGSTLRLWGLNTTFVSSSQDREGDLFVDLASLQITRTAGVVNVVAGHHHLSWIRQKRELEDHLNDVAPIQIFGHVHTNRIELNRDFVRLTASAMHPDRQEAGWEPGYNLVDVSVVEGQGGRRLRVCTHVRIWQTAPGGFRAKMDRDRDAFEHYIDLPAWKAAPAGAVPVVEDNEEPIRTEASETTPPDREPAMTTLRELGLRFYQLSFSRKAEIAGRLDLLEEGDTAQPDFERFRRVFIRAHERGKLSDLETAVRSAEAE